MGRFRSDAPPPERRGLPTQRVRRPGCILAVGLVAGILAAALTVILALLVLLRPKEPIGHNAIWIGIRWGEEVHTDDEVESLARLLHAEGIDVVYVWTSWLQDDGTWSETTFENMAAFVEQFKRYYSDARLDAWIGIPVELPDYRLDDEDIRAEIAAFSSQVLSTFGFDGIHLNAEPVWNGDEYFPVLLREVRQAIGEDIILSVAVPPDWNTGVPGIPAGPYTTADAHWSREYKQRVAFLSDEIAVMAYNSGLSTPEEYQIWMAYQVSQFAGALSPLGVDTQLIFGIPTYDAEPPGHDPAAESVPAAISGIKQGLDAVGAAAQLVRGVGIYAEWSTDAAEWTAYRQFWFD